MKISVTVTGVKGLQTALSRLSRIDGIFYNWMRTGEADKVMHSSFGKNFTQQGRPSKWSKLAESTQSQRQKMGYGKSSPILFRTGNLRDEVTNMQAIVVRGGSSVTATWGPQSMRGGSQINYSFHQGGTKNMPARPMIGFQDEDGPKLLRDFSNFLGRSLQ